MPSSPSVLTRLLGFEDPRIAEAFVREGSESNVPLSCQLEADGEACSILGSLTRSLRAGGKVRVGRIADEADLARLGDPGGERFTVYDLPVETAGSESHGGDD